LTSSVTPPPATAASPPITWAAVAAKGATAGTTPGIPANPLAIKVAASIGTPEFASWAARPVYCAVKAPVTPGVKSGAKSPAIDCASAPVGSVSGVYAKAGPIAVKLVNPCCS